MRFLDIDLDAFLNRIAHWPKGGRLDAQAYIPWAEDRLRSFLEKQCGLSTSHPIKGWFIENHDGAFDVMHALVTGGSGALDVVHVDAHADLGMGDPSWVDMIQHVAKSLPARRNPPRADCGLNLGSWLAYAVAAELVSSLVYVHPAGGARDLPPLYFLNGNPSSGFLEMKAYTRAGLPGTPSSPDYHALLQLAPDLALSPVPFAMETLDTFKASAPFDVALLCRSPDYTPDTSDALIPIIGEYIQLA